MATAGGYQGKKTLADHAGIVSVSRDTQCGFCGRTLDEMHVPRAFPCGHAHCTECINVNYQNKEIECKAKNCG